MGYGRRRGGCLSLCALWVGAAGCTAASADALVVAGGNAVAQEAGYSYAGVLAPLRGNLSDGMVWGLFVHRLTYSFETTAGETQATQWGGSALLGFRQRRGNGWTGVYGAVENDRIEERGVQRASRERWLGRVEAEAGSDAGVWHVDGRVNAVPALHGYWSRMTLVREVGPIRVGPEFMLHGNDDYRARQAGLALAGGAGPEATQWTISAGYQETGTSNSWYAGIGVTGHMR